MKFNDVFKANNYAGRKKILDRFPLSKEDKDDVNKSIEKLNNSSGEGGGNNSGGSVSKYAPRYFKIDFTKADSMWKIILSISDEDNAVKDSELQCSIGASYRTLTEKFGMICAYPFMNTTDHRYAFAYMPLYVIDDILEPLGLKSNLLTFEDILENIGKILVEFGKIDSYRVLSMEGITEITEEEFYKID